MTECPCKGKHARTWHNARELPVCEDVRKKERNRDSVRSRYWTPGSPILLPETEYVL